MFDVEDVDLEEEEEETGEAGVSENGVKKPRADNPLLKASKKAMEEMLVLKASQRTYDDADRAQELLSTIVTGRLAPLTPTAVKTAIAYDLELAFRIARDAWTNHR